MANAGNLGTLVQQIVDDLHISIPDVVRRKACQAMRFHRDKRYFFSDRELRFNLTANRANYIPGDGYGLPKDLVEVASKVIWILIDGSEDQRWACNRVDHVSWEWSKSAWGSSTSSPPEEWNWRGKELRFNPPPSSGNDVAELRYLTDIGVPKVVYENSAYKFFHPATGEEMTSTQLDAFSNDWLTQDGAEAAIRARTMYMVKKEYLRDPEGANEDLGSWLEMIAQLEAETESKVAGLQELPACLY